MIIAAIFLLMFGITFLICGIILSKKEKDFSENSKNGIAMVSGYETSENSSHMDIRVDVVGIESKTSILCHTKGIKNRSDFPVGTKVKVKYLEKNFLGVKYYDIRLDEEGYRPSNSTTLGYVFVLLGTLSLILAIIFGVLRIYF